MSLKAVIEKWRGKDVESLLRDMYITQNMSMDEISKELSISIGIVHRWLNEYGISKQKCLWK